MSSFNKNTANKSGKSGAYEKLCKVCQDSGKTIAEYTSHSVRDRSGATVCPTLLSQECRNCYKRGHTSKYCKVVQPLPTLKENSKPIREIKEKPIMPKNIFAMLDSDSDSEEDDVPKQKLVPTPVTKESLKAGEKYVLSYKTLIEKKYQEDQMPVEVVKQVKIQTENRVAYNVPTFNIIKNPVKKCKWADAESDSSGDEEEGDYYR